MKLQAKRIISADLATQRKSEIEKGIQLARQVDAVKATLSKETRALESFRMVAVAAVTQEIDVRIRRRDELDEQIKKKERILLKKPPLDLRKAWAKVESDQKENDARHERLNEFEVELVARDGDNLDQQKILSRREVETERREQLSERTLQEAERTFEKASVTLEKAQEKSTAILATAKEKETNAILREEENKQREKELIAGQRKLKEAEADLVKREKVLKDGRETLARAFNRLKK